MNQDVVVKKSVEGVVDSSVTKIRELYLESILVADHADATAAINKALALGVTPKNIYIHILIPAQHVVGERWSTGDITVSQEHGATQITLAEMGRLRPMLRRKPSIGKRIVITALKGDPHLLGGRMASDFLHMEGWDVDFLGADIPSADLVKFVAERQPDVVGISIALPEILAEASLIIGQLRQAAPQTKILVGGRLVTSDLKSIESLGADAWVQTAQEANDVARQVVGLPRSAESLPELLKAVGARISNARKSQRFSQQEIAAVSGLERAYISAVEHGKHNLTLGAVMRLAGALDVSIEDLIIGQE